jgi:GNAT superfamily N-acetyltransferase
MSGKKDIAEVLEEARRLYKIEKADTAGKEDLVGFFKTAYADQFNAADYRNSDDILARWEWSNVKNPSVEAGEFPAWFCKDRKSEEIVGHLGVIPALIKIKGNYHRAVWGKDMIVPARWRGSGIASLLFDTAMKRMEDRASLFLLGGSNDYAVAIYKRLGFTHLGYIPLYVRVLKPDAILQKGVGGAFPRGLLKFFGGIFLKIFDAPLWIAGKGDSKNIRVKEITYFDGSFDILWEKASSIFPVIIRRDSENLNWRFVNQPYWNYKIFKAEDRESGKARGYVVLREGQSHGLPTGVISDLFALPDDASTIASLVIFAVNYFKKMGRVDLIRCDILSRGFGKILRKTGFIRIRSKSHFMVKCMNREFDPAFILNSDNWFINYADSDLDLSGRR